MIIPDQELWKLQNEVACKSKVELDANSSDKPKIDLYVQTQGPGGSLKKLNDLKDLKGHDVWIVMLGWMGCVTDCASNAFTAIVGESYGTKFIGNGK